MERWVIYICCCFRSRWWWFYSSHSPPCCDEFFLLLFTERLKISPNKISRFLLFFLLTHSLFGDYDDSVLFTRALSFRWNAFSRSAESLKLRSNGCDGTQGASNIFFYKGFRKPSLRRTPGCENSTAKALLFWLVKSATIPLFCLEKFRSRALTQFNNSQHSRIVATNENEMWARIRAKQVVKDFFSVVGFWFYARHFSSRRVVLFSLMTMRQRLWTVKCIENVSRKNQEQN